ncbi:DUF4189 domain-containing protein [Luteibacter yeojuensis]|uniref:DUF4189 domain-containing protein n=1 Tax=Luteibacter yeojuensis TaxID=345309 RepID=A0A7X5TNZ6_9GAMM|nr:DUF4189 domain-containing protein [Luteibacter yeojuensis]
MRTLRMKPLQVMATCLAFMANAAWAQCATGVNTGGGNCVPPDAPGMPDYNSGQGNVPQPPPPKWNLTWGAIVIDSETGGAGTVVGRASENDAVRDATRDCASRGARGCKVEMTYRNGCGAVAWGTGGHGVASGSSQSGAERDAMRYCEQSAQGCKVVYSDCSAAQQVQ